MTQRSQTVALILVLAAVYYSAAEFGLSLAFVNTSASAVWPPTGIAVAALLLWGCRLWPGIFLGALIANLLAEPPAELVTQVSWMVVTVKSLGIATGNTLEAVLAAWLVDRFANGRRFVERAGDIFKFILLAVILSTAVSATVGVASLGLSGFAQWKNAFSIWITWWLGDAIGALVVSPLIVVWSTLGFGRHVRRRAVEALLILMGVFLISAFGYGAEPNAPLSRYLRFLLYPSVLWAAYRFGQHGAITAVFTVACVATWGTVHGLGPFISADSNQSLLLLQTYIGTLTVTNLILGAVVSEREKSEQRLRVQEAVNRVLAQSATLEEAAPKLLRLVGEAEEWDASALWRLDPGANELRCLEFWHAPGVSLSEFEITTRQRTFAIGEGLPGRVWSRTKADWILDVRSDQGFPRTAEAAREGLRSGFGFPIRSGEEILGVIECFSRKARSPQTDFLQTFSDIGGELGQFIERRQAETALIESEGRFRHMADSAPVLIWMSGTDKKCTYFNQPWLRFTGRTLEEEVGDGWAQGVHPEDLSRCVETYSICFDARKEFSMEYRLRRHDGEYRWFLDHGIPRFERADEFAGYIGSCIDITDRKQTEEELQTAKTELAQINEGLETRVRERTFELIKANANLQNEIMAHKEAEMALRASESKFRAFVESAPDATVIVGPDARILLVNHQTERVFGYPRAELLGQPLEMLLPERYKRTHVGHRTAFLGDPGVRPMGSGLELFGLRKDGSEFPVEISLSPINTPEGVLVCSSIRDISERKNAESARARLAAIVESSSDAIFSMSLEGTITSWNQGAEATLGYGADEMVGHSVSVLVPPDRRNELSPRLDLLGQGESIEPFETVRVGKDGRPVDVSVTLSPIKNEQGQVTGCSAIMRDIGERKRLEAEVLQVSEREQRRIAEDLHDGVGQQLGGISCLCDALKKDLADQASPQAVAAAKISNLLNGAVTQTRGLARGLHPVATEAYGLLSALDDMAARVSELFKVSCQFECPEPVLISNNVVATHLYRIAQEAISNAIKHGRAQQIEIRLSASGERISLSISDDGSGFDSLGRPTKGMGLRIMNHRAGMIGGQLVVQKRAPCGTEVICSVRESGT